MSIDIEEKVERLAAYVDVIRDQGPLTPRAAARKLALPRDAAWNPYQWLRLLAEWGILEPVLNDALRDRAYRVTKLGKDRVATLRVIGQRATERVKPKESPPGEPTNVVQSRAITAATRLERSEELF